MEYFAIFGQRLSLFLSVPRRESASRSVQVILYNLMIPEFRKTTIFYGESNTVHDVV